LTVSIAIDDLGCRPWLTPSFRFDGVNALRADEHVIDIEVIARLIAIHKCSPTGLRVSHVEDSVGVREGLERIAHG
jgi:hypothetical protein